MLTVNLKTGKTVFGAYDNDRGNLFFDFLKAKNEETLTFFLLLCTLNIILPLFGKCKKYLKKIHFEYFFSDCSLMYTVRKVSANFQKEILILKSKLLPEPPGAEVFGWSQSRHFGPAPVPAPALTL